MNMPMKSRSNLAQSPVHASRLPIFPPTRRPTLSTWEFNTPWGEGVVTGRLGQMHRDLIDAARMEAERRVVDHTGALHLLIDPARLRAALGWDTVTYHQIEDRLEDMRIAKVSTTIRATGLRVREGIVSSYAMAAAQPPERGEKVRHLAKPNGQAQAALLHGGGLWRVSFSQSWSMVLLEDHQYSYPLREVMELQHGVSQALARFCLSHKWVHEGLPSVLTKLGACGRQRKRLSELRVDAAALRALGVDVSDGMCRYGAHPQPREGAPTTP